MISILLVLICFPAYAKYYWPNGFYFNVGGTFGYMRLNKLNGTSTLKRKYSHEWKPGAIVAVGYTPKEFPFRVDVAYTIIDNISYDINPVFTDVANSGNLTSDLRSQAVFVNGYYDIPFMNKILPYIGVGVGWGSNKTDTKVVTSGATYKKDYTKTGLAWQATVGIRLKLTRNVLFDIAAKHIDFGKAQWGPWSAANKITADSVTADEGMASITIFFGDQEPYQPPELINDYD